jgi:hypothetical protein
LRIFSLILFLCQVLALWAVPAFAQEGPAGVGANLPDHQQNTSLTADAESQIRNLDRQILLELIKLAQYNVHYEKTVNHYAWWRAVGYPLAQEADYACLLGYTLNDMNQRSRGWNNPRLISPIAIKRGLSAATVGTLVGAASSVGQLAASGLETARANKRGCSVRKSISVVQSSVRQVDEMLAIRSRLMSEAKCTGAQRELLELKEQLLEYERDRLTFEFERWSSHSRGYAWYKNTFYAINATVNLARFSAIVLGFDAFTHPRCSGGIGPVAISAAVLAGIGPVSSTIAGNLMNRYQMRCLTRELPAHTELSDEQAKRKFDRLAQLLELTATNQESGQLAADLVRLREEKVGLDTLIFGEERNIQRFRRVAGQLNYVVPELAVLGVSSGVLSTVGYYGYRHEPLVANRLNLTGDIAIVPAEAVALVATPAVAAMSYAYEQKLKKKGEHPDQLAAKRQQDLKTLEMIITESLNK